MHGVVPRLTLVAALLTFCVVTCNNLPGKWRAEHQRPLWDGFYDNENNNGGRDAKDVNGFQLIIYLPYTHENTYCKGILNAITQNNRLKLIERIDLFRHSKSCISSHDIPISNKIVVHEVGRDRNMTFADLMKFIVHECTGKVVLLAKANMLFQNNLDSYLKEGIESGVVHVLKSIHPAGNTPYDGTHYAFIFRGQWDKTESSFDTAGMQFELESPRLDNENVMMKVFEVGLNMNLKASHVQAYPICLH